MEAMARTEPHSSPTAAMAEPAGPEVTQSRTMAARAERVAIVVVALAGTAAWVATEELVSAATVVLEVMVGMVTAPPASAAMGEPEAQEETELAAMEATAEMAETARRLVQEDRREAAGLEAAVLEELVAQQALVVEATAVQALMVPTGPARTVHQAWLGRTETSVDFVMNFRHAFAASTSGVFFSRSRHRPPLRLHWRN